MWFGVPIKSRVIIECWFPLVFFFFHNCSSIFFPLSPSLSHCMYWSMELGLYQTLPPFSTPSFRCFVATDNHYCFAQLRLPANHHLYLHHSLASQAFQKPNWHSFLHHRLKVKCLNPLEGPRLPLIVSQWMQVKGSKPSKDYLGFLRDLDTWSFIKKKILIKEIRYDLGFRLWCSRAEQGSKEGCGIFCKGSITRNLESTNTIWALLK